jgi:hypothetical protein
MLSIHQTTNYKQFKFFPSNREIVPHKVEESILKKNMLSTHPIIVDPEFRIIDGQNRFTVAQKHKLPIYYLMSDEISEEDIPQCQVQRTWDLKNYLKFYLDKTPEYAFINEIVKDYHLPLYFIVSVCGSTEDPFKRFREGHFKLNRPIKVLRNMFEQMYEILVNCEELCKPLGVKVIYKVYRAFWSLMLKDDYDQKKLLRKLRMRRDQFAEILKYRNLKNIVEGLEIIYSYKDQGKKQSSKYVIDV